ncbi:tRNA (adenosine(37)-N6)-dimethylallyltransferase MiaA [Parerythrobacter jejuensis]|uniref:tRNA dimethylallyltransferase n=1 Tax=Parerythrobacter jejuensis TaxID=795812 RepID=A0A845AN58_9SPHN|nr:tRNA (adenosine(37)-N6)-dimethylallyltransferase MiaA [Parerythrobacter jejuensis]MXP32252.1 tRNA (adenosine(37)-N6)-dimethylallyltransferase MiaA [Parerythrobacter jejuensis]
MWDSPTDLGTRPPLALIAGPTASGKSDVAVKLALALGKAGKSAVVINADSAQVYAELSVLSARPTETEMQGIPHCLFGTWDGATPCSAADWSAHAKREIARAHTAGEIPILVGGTGMYIKTLLEGIADIPPIDPAIRETVRALPREEAYAALATEDPDRHAKLDAGDSQRIARALEVVRSTGVTMGQWQNSKAGGIGDEVSLHPLLLLPERQRLYARCDMRFEQMLKQGAIAEVEALLARDLSPDLPVMRAIGVPEITAWLKGKIDRDQMIASGQQSTRNYAKRQYTWFRRQPPEEWRRVDDMNYNSDDVWARLFQS